MLRRFLDIRMSLTTPSPLTSLQNHRLTNVVDGVLLLVLIHPTPTPIPASRDQCNREIENK